MVRHRITFTSLAIASFTTPKYAVCVCGGRYATNVHEKDWKRSYARASSTLKGHEGCMIMYVENA